MLIIITLLIVTTAGHKVTDSVEDLPPDAFKTNTTTLYPVSNQTSNESKEKTKINGDATAWKLEATFAETNEDKTASNSSSSESVEQEKKGKNKSEEFKPSPHLGTFFDDESFEMIPTRATLGEFRPMKKPASGFISFQKDKLKSHLFNPPKEVFTQNEFPYKFESGILTRSKDPWKPSDSLDSRPTMESPMRVPAGGLYKAPVPEAFPDKPDDEDFGLNFNDIKDPHNHHDINIKKRVDPWKNLLRLITAFIPVGLIISALTPNIITVESTGPENSYPHQVFRRSDSSGSELAPISEPCRRRLLCELHSDNNYTQGQVGRGRRKHCHRIHCDEPEALAKMLQWLLAHRASKNKGQHLT